MNRAEKRKVLGKGLSALLPTRVPAPVTAPEASPAGTAAQIPVDLIDTNPLQPRTVFDQARIEELAASIEANGIIQPLILRRQGARYELVAGERRLRAAKHAKLTTVPAIIQDYADNRMLETALIENIQREDLNPIETAQALERLGQELHLSHEEIGQRTGKDRATVTNLLRLLRLPERVQVFVAEHRLSMGHARALLSLNDPNEQVRLAEMAMRMGWSVRQVEAMTQERKPTAAAVTPAPPDPNVAAAVRDLEGLLGTKVRIVAKSPKKGRIEIDYFSQDELTRIYELLSNAATS